jgi:hypothetical protein
MVFAMEQLNPKIREDILHMLRDTLNALKQKEFSILRELSDHSLHNASIFQDEYSVSAAVVIYALSKITDRAQGIDPKIIEALGLAQASLEKNDLKAYEQNIAELSRLISETDSKMQKYVHQVISEARIKKASRIYEHGISLAQTAKLLGTTEWELMKYVGQTTIADYPEGRSSAVERLHFARRLFGAK